MRRYNVLTYDPATEKFTPQENLKTPSQDISVRDVHKVLKELNTMGYAATFDRTEFGNCTDPSVLIQETE